MLYHQLFDLDQRLESTWRTYSDFIKSCLLQNHLNEAFSFLDNLTEKEFHQTTGDFVLYKSLLYCVGNHSNKALDVVKEAWRFGYPRFWKFIPDSLGCKSSTIEDLRLLTPLHKDTDIQAFARSVFSDNVSPWGFDVCKTPFCWFEKTLLKRKSAKCYVSGKSINNGSEIYQFRFFNGSFDIPSDFFVACKEAFDNHKGALENLKKYNTNSYYLADYRFKINYKHPLINSFWHTIDKFDLKETLKLIANPPVYSSPFVKYDFTEYPLPIFHPDNPEHKIEKRINGGTGGHFVNLLYVLIKCGFIEEITNLFPELPSHFPLLLLFFKNAYIPQVATNNASFNELNDLLELAFRPYSEKTPQDVKRLAEFGHSNSEFRHNLSEILNIYELHLYSNSQPGANWFFQDFHRLNYARGGGLLDFLIAEPELIPVMKEMLQSQIYPTGLSLGIVDAYENSLPFLYRTVSLSSIYRNKKDGQIWMSLPCYLRESSSYRKLRTMHNKTIKIAEHWKTNSNSNLSLGNN